MSKYRLSIVVPVYNVESRLKICVESILNQTYQDFELVLVDDGSTDLSGSLCDEYTLIDDRVVVIHIKNSGPFQARKIGIKHAKGEIITFSDADDWLEHNAFETAMEVMDKYNPDIFTYAYAYEHYSAEKHLYKEGIYYKEGIKNMIIPGMMYDPFIGERRLNPSLSCKYIKKKLLLQLIDNVKDRITLGDDALISYPLVCKANSLFISNQSLYHYCNNSSSCTHTFPLQRIIEVKKFQDNIISLFNEMGLLEDLRYQIENYVRIFLNRIVNNWYGINISSVMFSFPYNLFEKGMDIVVYGAGNVGRSYINEIRVSNYVNIVGWADRNYENMKVYNSVKVISPQMIKGIFFDKLLIAISEEKIVHKIKNNLIKSGIPESKIIWTKPLPVI